MKKKNTYAFTLIEVLVVVAILALLSAIAIPAMQGSFQTASTQMKAANVDTVESAKEQWALLNNKADGQVVTWDQIKDFVAIGKQTVSQSSMDVDGASININAIGTRASY